jgi:hypothetical protein
MALGDTGRRFPMRRWRLRSSDATPLPNRWSHIAVESKIRVPSDLSWANTNIGDPADERFRQQLSISRFLSFFDMTPNSLLDNQSMPAAAIRRSPAQTNRRDTP